MKWLAILFPIWIIISYDKVVQHGIMVEIYKVCQECVNPRRLILSKEINPSSKRDHYDFDSLFITYTRPTDVYEVTITGIKRGRICDTYVDTLQAPHFTKSYGMNFVCDTVITSMVK
jgi:hypothetical protein